MKKTLYILLFFSIGFSVNKTGTSAAKFLSISPGGKAVSMGGAFTSLSNDISCLYWNPSGIARLDSHGAFFTHIEWLADISYDFVGFTIPFDASTIGLSAIFLTMDEMEIRRYGDENTGETFKAGSYALNTTWAMNLTNRFSVGFTGKYIREKIYNSIATGFAVDVGTLFKTTWGPQLGVMISNFGPKMKMDGPDLLVNADVSEIEGNNSNINAELSTDLFTLPLVLRFGLSDYFKIKDFIITWSIDAVNPIDNSEYLNLGFEFSFWEHFCLRMGAKSLFMYQREELFTVGMGSKIDLFSGKCLSFDYSHESFKYLPSTHQFSIGINY